MNNNWRMLIGNRLTTAVVSIILTLTVVAQASANSGSELPVITAPVQLSAQFSDPVEALGTTKANESVSISANVTETISRILFDDGQQVKQGDILLTLEKSEEEADLKAAQALLDERMASYKRAQSLQKQQALSTATLEERLALLSQTEGAIEAIQSRIDDRIIKAPFDGVLGLRNVSPGTLVRPGDLITTIDDLSRIKVDFEVPSLFLAEITPGLKVSGQIDAFGDKLFEGRVSTINTQIDPITRTMTVRAILPNPDLQIRPGLLMRVTLMKSPRTAMLIPEEAIIQKDKRFFVFRIAQQDGKTIAVETQVTPGSRIPGKIEIKEGLQPHDQVIIHGLMQVRHNQEVTVRALAEQPTPLDILIKGTQANDKAAQL